MLQNVNVRPISEVEAIAIQAQTMQPGWNSGRHDLVIYKQPTNSRNSDLLCLVIEADALITSRLFRLGNCLIECGITPLTVVICRVRRQVQCQPIIRIGEVRAPLNRAKLYRVLGCLCIIRHQVYRAQVDANAKRCLPPFLESIRLAWNNLRSRIREGDWWHLTDVWIHRLHQGSRFFFIIWYTGIIWLVARHSWWNDRRCNDHRIFENRVNQGLFVYGIGKSLAHR